MRTTLSQWHFALKSKPRSCVGSQLGNFEFARVYAQEPESWHSRHSNATAKFNFPVSGRQSTPDYSRSSRHDSHGLQRDPVPFLPSLRFLLRCSPPCATRASWQDVPTVKVIPANCRSLKYSSVSFLSLLYVRPHLVRHVGLFFVHRKEQSP